MENCALITLAEEIRGAAVGMTVRRVTRYPHRVLFLETRSGRMPGLRLSLDARNPGLWIPDRSPSVSAGNDDFTMLIRKHVLDARLTGIEKPLSERTIELEFRTVLPADALRHVRLVVELVPNSPNLLLLDSARHVLGSALPVPPNRGFGPLEAYRPRETGKTPLEEVRAGEAGWFDEEAFTADPKRWLLTHVAGLGPVMASEIAYRSRLWTREPGGVPAGFRTLLDRLCGTARTAWVYTARPLSVILEEGDATSLRSAVVSPIELESYRRSWSCQTFPGMLAATSAIAGPLEDATLLDRARRVELKRLRRELKRLELRRERLVGQQHRFADAAKLSEAARLLAASGAEMDRHHDAVKVREYTEDGARERQIMVDTTRTLRENIRRMFGEQQKASRGAAKVSEELTRVGREEARLRARRERLRALAHWDEWLPVAGTTRKKAAPARQDAPSSRPKKRYRSVEVDGHEVLVGRNSRENEELTFHVAQPQDFWLHVADYSGSHVVLRNPTGAEEPEAQALERAAGLAAYHSQARNSSRVEVHYTQRRFVTKPRRARPGLVRLRQYRTITVEPRDCVGELSRSGADQPAETAS